MSRRSQESSRHIVASLIKSSDIDNADKSNDIDLIVPIASPMLSSNCTKSKNLGESLIATPKSSNCSTVLNIRRSKRIKKPPVVKICQGTKYTYRSSKKLTGINDTSTSKNDQGISEEFSPLCVKKKMRHRSLRSNKLGSFRKSHNRPCIKTRSMSNPHHVSNAQNRMHDETFTTDETSVCESKSKLLAPDVDIVEGHVASLSQCIDLTQTIVEGKKNESQNLKYSHHENEHKVIGAQRVCSKSAGISDQNVASVLFEDSGDFWDGFLLETYRQIASNNPDMYDFEPIPYPMLSRGVPVDVESFPKPSIATGIIVEAIRDIELTNVSTGHKTTIPTSNESSSNGSPQEMQLQLNKAGGKAYYAMKGQTFKAHASGLNVCDGVDSFVDTQYSSEIKNIVGPDSWQMDVIYRMIFYLGQDINCPYSMHFKKFEAVTEKFTKRHFAGHDRFRHLPGAIFEQLVSDVGGPTFLSIYMAAKKLSYGRLRGNHGTQDDVDTSSSTAPSLIDIAVGYGYHIAQSLTLKESCMSSDICESNTTQIIVKQGAQTVLKMSKQHQLQFWNDCILQNAIRR